MPEMVSKSENQKKADIERAPFLVDGHVDLTYFLMNLLEDMPLSALKEGPFTLKKMREVGLRLFSDALYCQDQFNGEESLGHLDEILRFTRDHFDPVRIIKGSTDLENLKKDPHMVGTILLLENADALAGNLAYVEELIGAGIRIVGLTHRGRNRIGDGDGVLVARGFSLDGMEVIRALDHHGLIIDVAHLHPKCFWKLLDIFNGTMVSSHTGVREACNIQRNMDVNQAGEVIGRGGLVGVTCNPEMLQPEGKANIEDIFMHVDILVQKLGPEGVGIGSDFCGFDRATEGLEDVGKVPRLMDVMLDHGYGEEAVAKIMGLNWLRIYEHHFSLALS